MLRPGGTGKTFLIHRIRKLTNAWLDAQRAFNMGIAAHGDGVAVMAFTGVAAKSANAQTIHSSLKVLVQHDAGTDGSWTPLAAHTLQKLREEHRGDVLVIVDELSLVSNQLLNTLSMRLNEVHDINKPDKYFGDLPVIAFGDFGQLPPVRAKALYKTTKGINLYRQLFEPVFLTQPMRQLEDQYFAKLLGDSIRWGKIDEDGINTLKQRCLNDKVNPNAALLKPLLQTSFKDAMYLFDTNKKCDDLNITRSHECARQHDGTLYLCRSFDVFIRDDDNVPISQAASSVAKNRFPFGEQAAHDITDTLPSHKTGGLPTTLPLCVGQRVMLRDNLNVLLGLTNGALGTILRIEWTTSETNFAAVQRNRCVLHELLNERNCRCQRAMQLVAPIPTAVYVQFDGLPEPVRIAPKATVIKAATRQITRHQIPLLPAYAITIHKCQSLTLPKIVIDLGHRLRPALAYTALSRVRSLQDLLLLDFIPESIQADEAANGEYDRLSSIAKDHAADLQLEAVDKSMDAVNSAFTETAQILADLEFQDDPSLFEADDFASSFIYSMTP
jgi:ATP-dependent DNA helicase PIF1